MVNQIDFPVVAANCQACGTEYIESELHTIKLAGFNSTITVCKSCLDKTVETSFKDAADILGDIVSIAKSEADPEIRLNLIRNLIGE
jgi:hypothetical protein